MNKHTLTLAGLIGLLVVNIHTASFMQDFKTTDPAYLKAKAVVTTERKAADALAEAERQEKCKKYIAEQKKAGTYNRKQCHQDMHCGHLCPAK